LGCTLCLWVRSTPRPPREAAILANAASLIIAHNHPSGDPMPSRADHEMLRRLATAGAPRHLGPRLHHRGHGRCLPERAGSRLHAKDVRVSIDADSRIARAISYSFAILEFAPGFV
jgi:hypothetical protein